MRNKLMWYSRSLLMRSSDVVHNHKHLYNVAHVQKTLNISIMLLRPSLLTKINQIHLKKKSIKSNRSEHAGVGHWKAEKMYAGFREESWNTQESHYSVRRSWEDHGESHGEGVRNDRGPPHPCTLTGHATPQGSNMSRPPYKHAGDDTVTVRRASQGTTAGDGLCAPTPRGPGC